MWWKDSKTIGERALEGGGFEKLTGNQEEGWGFGAKGNGNGSWPMRSEKCGCFGHLGLPLKVVLVIHLKILTQKFRYE